MYDSFQLAGAALLLGAFGLAQFGKLNPGSYIYIFLNLVGSAVLAVTALIGAQWGFFILEAAWAVISLVGLRSKLDARRAKPA
jgi:hypothetical protein